MHFAKKTLLFIFLSLMLSMVVSFLWLYTSQTAPRWIAKSLSQAVGPMQLEITSGSLATGLHVDYFRWRADSVDVIAEEAFIDVSPSCLTSLCVNTADFKLLQIVFKENDTVEDSSTDLSNIPEPFIIAIEEGRIDTLRFVNEDQIEDVTGIELSADWTAGDINIAKLHGRYRGIEVQGQGVFSMIGGWRIDISGDATITDAALRQAGLEPFFNQSFTAPFQISGEGIAYRFEYQLPNQYAGTVNGAVDFSREGAPFNLAVTSESTWMLPAYLKQQVTPLFNRTQQTLTENDYSISGFQLNSHGHLLGLDFTADVQLQTPLWPVQRIHSRGVVETSAVRLQRIQVDFEEGSLTGEGVLFHSPFWNGKFILDVASLEFNNTPLKLPLSVDGGFDIDLELGEDAFDIKLAVDDSTVVYDGHSLGGDVDASAHYRPSTAEWSFSADLLTHWQELPPFRLSTVGTYQAQKLDLSKLKLTFDDLGKDLSAAIKSESLEGRAYLVTSNELPWELDLSANSVRIPKTLLSYWRDDRLESFISQAEQSNQLTAVSLSGDFRLSGNMHEVNVAVRKVKGVAEWHSDSLHNRKPGGGKRTVSADVSDSLLFSVDSVFDWQYGEQILIDALSLRWFKSLFTARGGVSWSTAHSIEPLTFEFNEIHLEDWQTQAKGVLSGNGLLRGTIDSPDIKGRATLTDFSAPHVLAKEVTLDVDVKDLGEGLSRMVMKADSLMVNEKPIDSLGMTLSGSRQKLALSSKITLNKQADVVLSCQGQEKSDQWSADCERIEIRQTKDLWGLQAPLKLQVSKQDAMVQIEPLCFHDLSSIEKPLVGGDAALICSSAPLMFKPGEVNGALKLTSFPVNWLKKYWPALAPVEGMFDADFSFSQSKIQPFSADLNVRAKALQVVAMSPGVQKDAQNDRLPDALDFRNFRFNARVKDNDAVINSTFGIGDEGAFKLDISVLDIEKTETLKGNLSVSKYNLSMLQAFVPELEKIAGKVNASMKVSGTLKDPKVAGHWQLFDGEVDTSQLSEPIKDIQLSGQLNENQMSYLGSFVATSGGAKVDGQMNWRNDWWLTARVKSDKITLLPMHGVRLDFKPDLFFKLTGQDISVSGDVTIPSGKIELVELPVEAKTVSSDARVIREGGDESSSWKVNTDVNVTLGENVHFKGLGVQTYIQGGLHLKQKNDVLFTSGELFSREGKLSFLGQRLDIDEGRIIFNGALDNPDVYIEAVRDIEADNVSAGVRLTGKANAPKLDVFSEPIMEETVVLHYIMTGRKPVDGSTYGAGIAGNLLLDRVGAGNRWFSEKVVGKLGVTDFQISTQDQEEGASVQLSGYLSPDLYLQYGVKLFSEVNTLSLRYRLQSNLFLEAMTGLDSSLDVIYSFEVK